MLFRSERERERENKRREGKRERETEKESGIEKVMQKCFSSSIVMDHALIISHNHTGLIIH